ncbi:MAG: S8 family serine peptidase [Patescibacteria group bacterium]
MFINKLAEVLKRNVHIPRLFFLFMVGAIIVDLAFLFLGYHGDYSNGQSFSLLVILLVVIGVYLLIIYWNNEEKKWIKRALILSIIWVFTAGIAISQIVLFTEDSLNLEKSDPFLFKAYSIIKIDKTWNLLNNLTPGLSLTPVKIGVIDTGIDFLNGRHPEFVGIDIFGLTASVFRDTGVLGFTGEGHGTQVAGIIGANNISFPDPNKYEFPHMNGIVSGVHDLDYILELGKKPIFPLPLFGLGSMVETLAERQVKIINMSFGSKTPITSLLGELLGFVYTRIFAFNPDILFVVGAGNFDFDFLGINIQGVNAELTTPGNFGDNFSNVISVGATDIQLGLENTRASFSNFGDAVNIAAPGIAVYAPAPRGKGNFPSSTLNYDQFFSGTSAATPLVTGVAAILKSIKPELTPAEIKNILTRSADPLFVSSTSPEAGKQLGSGCFGTSQFDQVFRGCRLNALKAVQSILTPKPPKPYTLNPHTLFYVPLDNFYVSFSQKFFPELADSPNIPDLDHDCRITFQAQPDSYTLEPGQFGNALRAKGRGQLAFRPPFTFIPEAQEGQIFCNNRPIRLVGNLFPDYTVGFWLKSNTPPDIIGYIFFVVNTAGDSRPIWVLLDSLGRLLAVTHPPFAPQSNLLISDNPKILDNNWHHYLLTFNHTQRKINLFIDGMLDQQIPIITNILPSGENALELLLSDTTRGFFPNAALDDFFVENRAWTQEDIARFLISGDVPLNNPHAPEMPDFNTLPDIPLPSFTTSTFFSTSTMP